MVSVDTRTPARCLRLQCPRAVRRGRHQGQAVQPGPTGCRRSRSLAHRRHQTRGPPRPASVVDTGTPNRWSSWRCRRARRGGGRVRRVQPQGQLQEWVQPQGQVRQRGLCRRHRQADHGEEVLHLWCHLSTPAAPVHSQQGWGLRPGLVAAPALGPRRGSTWEQPLAVGRVSARGHHLPPLPPRLLAPSRHRAPCQLSQAVFGRDG